MTRRPPLLSLLLLATVAYVAVAVAVTGTLAHRSGQQAVLATAASLQRELATSLEREVLHTLDAPHLVNRLNRDALASELVDPWDDDALVRRFLHQLEAYPAISYVQLGRADGSFVGVERTEHGFVAEVTLPDGSGKGVHPLDPDGRRARPTSVVAGYDATTRPWYRAAVAAGGPTWSEIYQFSSREAVRLGITAVEPVTLPDGQRAVVGTDLVLSHLSRFLHDLPLPEGGRVFVVDRQGVLVAASSVGEPFHVSEGTTEGRRLAAAAADDPLTAAAARALAPDLARLEAPARLDLTVDGRRAWLVASPVHDGRGIDWVAGVVLPEAGLVDQLAAANRRAAAIILVAVLTSSIVGAALAFSQLRSLLERARQADQAKTTFLASMSHELRTPMNAILGYTELLLEDSEDQGQQRDLGRIHDAATHLRHLIDQMLDLSRIEAGALTIEPRLVDVGEVCSQVAEVLGPLLSARQNRLDLDTGDAPILLHTDPARVRQCLLNLVGNAAKYTEQGTIRLVARETEEKVHIDVIDTGPGIAPDLLPQLFEPFVRAPGDDRGQGSSGLGLAITKRIAEALGGDVTVWSKLGEGSTFRLVLPRHTGL